MARKFEFVYRDTVRYADCDMHAHMNHATYFSFFEQARVAYLQAAGMKIESTKESIPFILVHASCDYKAPALLNDEVTVEVGVTHIGHTSLTLEFLMVRETDQTVLAEGKTVLVMYDYKQQKPIPVSDLLRQGVATLKKKARLT